MSLPQDGAILVDKPEGITSAQVVHMIKTTFDLKKVGHAGTLDPLATGLLIILLGKATRLQSLFLDETKSYEGVFLFGLATDTDDLSGKVVSEDSELVSVSRKSPQEIERELERVFCGSIDQVPPLYSALRREGKRCYALARRGEAVNLSARVVNVYSLKLSFVEPPKRLAYAMAVSKGTYVRAIARDMGKHLGVPACVESIRRVAVGKYLVRRAIKLENLRVIDLQGESLLSMEEIVGHLPRATLSEREYQMLKKGNQKALAEIAAKTKLVDAHLSHELAALYDCTQKFRGMMRKRGTPDAPRWCLEFML